MNDLVGRSKADAFMRVTELKPKGHYELTVLTNGFLPLTYRVYKEITCSPRLVESKGVPIRKGSRKTCPKEIPKRKRFLIPQGDVNALLL